MKPLLYLIDRNDSRSQRHDSAMSDPVLVSFGHRRIRLVAGGHVVPRVGGSADDLLQPLLLTRDKFGLVPGSDTAGEGNWLEHQRGG